MIHNFDENNTNYGVNKDTGADTIKYDTRVLKPNLCVMQKLIC